MPWAERQTTLGPVSIPHCSAALSLGQVLHGHSWVSVEPLNSVKLSKFLMRGKLLQRYRGRILLFSACKNKICWTKLFKAELLRNKFIGKSCKILKITRASNRFVRSCRYTQKWYLEFFSLSQSNQPHNGKTLAWMTVLDFFCLGWV